MIEKPTSILLIEDDVDLARILSMELEARGFDVFVAHDGASAIVHHAASGADMLIVDLGLPDMTGLDLLDRIRGGLGSSGVRTIIYTASDPDSESRRRIAGMGADLANKGRVSTQALVERVVRAIDTTPFHPLQVA